MSAQFNDRLPCERSGTSDSSSSRPTTSTASPLTIVASGQSSGPSSVEDTTVAGMFLVQAGQRSTPLIRQAIAQGHYLPMALTIAADIGAEELVPQIRHFTTDSDPATARAAREALELLALRKGGGSQRSP